MDGEYEYVAVKMPGRLVKDLDRLATETINKVAQHGWRLVSVTEQLAVFERAKQS